MRIMVYKEKDGVQQVIVRPSRESGLPPVLVKGTNRDDVLQEVANTIGSVRRASKVTKDIVELH